MTTNRTALITGASSGIGKETTKTLLAKGYTVYGAARRVEQMRDIEELGARILGMDISSEEDIQSVVAQIEREQGGIDFLINNAGYGIQGSMEDTLLEDARALFDVNLFGLARLTQLALPSMRKKGAGRIVNVSSAAGRTYVPLASWYVASKYALEGWSDCLRNELSPFGIQVVIIEPGSIETEFDEVSLRRMEERAGDGPYAEMTRRFIAKSSGIGGSHPSVIANAILHAVESKKPKTRYAAGKMARLPILMLKWLGDGTYDRILAGMLRQGGDEPPAA